MWPFGRTGSIGRRGERLAAGHLRRLGCRILGRNYRCPAGEADLIVLDRSTRPETLAFVEVKTRRSGETVSPEYAVDRRKQAQIVRVARYYLSTRAAEEYAVRFDVVAITWPDRGRPEIRHIPDAFRPE